MKPFDDSLPEERETRYRDIIELVQSSARAPSVETLAQQDQIIARVSQRLAEFEYAINSSENAELAEPENTLSSDRTAEPLSLKPINTPEKQAHSKRQRPLIFNTLAAVLVVSLLIGISLLLFERYPRAVTTVGSVGPAVVTHVEAGGLDLSLSVTPGPYFLGELLEVHMTLTNHSSTAYQIRGVKTASVCFPALFAALTGGEKPQFTLLDGDRSNFIFCPRMGESPFRPGEVISISQYVPLTKSGQQTLAVSYALGSSTNDARSANPLENQPLAFEFYVAPDVPADRAVLSLHQQGSKVAINAPSSLHLQFAYLYYITCKNALGQPTEYSGADFDWFTVAKNVIDKPECATESVPHAQWQLTVGAVGYELVRGTFSI